MSDNDSESAAPLPPIGVPSRCDFDGGADAAEADASTAPAGFARDDDFNEPAPPPVALASRCEFDDDEEEDGGAREAADDANAGSGGRAAPDQSPVVPGFKRDDDFNEPAPPPVALASRCEFDDDEEATPEAVGDGGKHAPTESPVVPGFKRDDDFNEPAPPPVALASRCEFDDEADGPADAPRESVPGYRRDDDFNEPAPPPVALASRCEFDNDDEQDTDALQTPPADLTVNANRDDEDDASSDLNNGSGVFGLEPSEAAELQRCMSQACLIMAPAALQRAELFGRTHNAGVIQALDAPWIASAAAQGDEAYAAGREALQERLDRAAQLAVRAAMLGLATDRVSVVRNAACDDEDVVRLGPGTYLPMGTACVVHLWSDVDAGRQYVRTMEDMWATLTKDARVAGMVIELPSVSAAWVCGQFCTVATVPPVSGCDDVPPFAPLEAPAFARSPVLSNALVRTAGSGAVPRTADVFLSSGGRVAMLAPTNPPAVTPTPTSASARQAKAQAGFAARFAVGLPDSADGAEVVAACRAVRAQYKRTKVPLRAMASTAIWALNDNVHRNVPRLLFAEVMARQLKGRARRYLRSIVADVTALAEERGPAAGRSFYRELSSSVAAAITTEILQPLNTNDDSTMDDFIALWRSVAIDDILMSEETVEKLDPPPRRWVAARLEDLLESIDGLVAGDGALPAARGRSTLPANPGYDMSDPATSIAATARACAAWLPILQRMIPQDADESSPSTVKEPTSTAMMMTDNSSSDIADALPELVSTCIAVLQSVAPERPYTEAAAPHPADGNGKQPHSQIVALDVFVVVRVLLAAVNASVVLGRVNTAALSVAVDAASSRWWVDRTGRVPRDAPLDDRKAPPAARMLLTHCVRLQRFAVGLTGPLIRELRADEVRLGDMDAIVAAGDGIACCIEHSDPDATRVVDRGINTRVPPHVTFLDAFCTALAAHAVGAPLGPHYVIAEYATRHFLRCGHLERAQHSAFPRRWRVADFGVAALAAVLVHADQLAPSETPESSARFNEALSGLSDSDEREGVRDRWRQLWQQTKAALLDTATALSAEVAAPGPGVVGVQFVSGNVTLSRARVLARGSLFSALSELRSFLQLPAVVGGLTHPRAEKLAAIVTSFDAAVGDGVPCRAIQYVQRIGRGLIGRRHDLPAALLLKSSDESHPERLEGAHVDPRQSLPASPQRTEQQTKSASPAHNSKAAESPAKSSSSPARADAATVPAADGSPLVTTDDTKDSAPDDAASSPPPARKTDGDAGDDDDDDDASYVRSSTATPREALTRVRDQISDVEAGRDVPVDDGYRFHDDGYHAVALLSHASAATPTEAEPTDTVGRQFAVDNRLRPDFAADTPTEPTRRHAHARIEQAVWRSMAAGAAVTAVRFANPWRRRLFDEVQYPEVTARRSLLRAEVLAFDGLFKRHRYRVHAIRALEHSQNYAGMPALVLYLRRTPSEKVSDEERELLRLHKAARMVQCAFRCNAARFELRYRKLQDEYHRRQRFVALAIRVLQRFMRGVTRRRRQRLAGAVVATSVVDATDSSPDAKSRRPPSASMSGDVKPQEDDDDDAVRPDDGDDEDRRHADVDEDEVQPSVEGDEKPTPPRSSSRPSTPPPPADAAAE